jgi:hypothetical protein
VVGLSKDDLLGLELDYQYHFALSLLALCSLVAERTQRPSQLRTIEKKGAFLLPKIEFSPSNPNSEKIIASFKVLS